MIDEVVSLPVEERARVVDTLLRSLNAPESAIDAAWMEVAQRRLDELRAGRVEAVPGEAVFERIRQRYEKWVMSSTRKGQTVVVMTLRGQQPRSTQT
ncbi:MAG: addiction module protein, partial [Thiobacillus sp.]|nr:addiction module protein [Thiobacillus sp.]